MKSLPSRPWWQKKRWIALTVLSMEACYVLSLFPCGYVIGLKLAPRPIEASATAYLAPITLLDGTAPGDGAENLVRLGDQLGRDHREAIDSQFF